MLTAEIKVIIAGTRTFDNYELLKSKMDFYLNERKDVEVVSGKARGADSLGERYAFEKGFPVKEFFPDWSIGKQAGYLRNRDMALYSTHAVIFRVNKSKGATSMINLAKKYNLVLRIIDIST